MSNNTIFNSLAYQELRASGKGQSLIAHSKSEAATFLFDLESGGKNRALANRLPATKIYDTIMLSSSLTFDIDGKQHTLKPIYSKIDHDTAVDILEDLQLTLEGSLLSAALESAVINEYGVFQGA